jgi:hypothetical protein
MREIGIWKSDSKFESMSLMTENALETGTGEVMFGFNAAAATVFVGPFFKVFVSDSSYDH